MTFKKCMHAFKRAIRMLNISWPPKTDSVTGNLFEFLSMVTKLYMRRTKFDKGMPSWVFFRWLLVFLFWQRGPREYFIRQPSYHCNLSQPLPYLIILTREVLSMICIYTRLPLSMVIHLAARSDQPTTCRTNLNPFNWACEVVFPHELGNCVLAGHANIH